MNKDHIKEAVKTLLDASKHKKPDILFLLNKWNGVKIEGKYYQIKIITPEANQ